MNTGHAQSILANREIELLKHVCGVGILVAEQKHLFEHNLSWKIACFNSLRWMESNYPLHQGVTLGPGREELSVRVEF